jgi:hypothetical protein
MRFGWDNGSFSPQVALLRKLNNICRSLIYAFHSIHALRIDSGICHRRVHQEITAKRELADPNHQREKHLRNTWLRFRLALGRSVPLSASHLAMMLSIHELFRRILTKPSEPVVP